MPTYGGLRDRPNSAHWSHDSVVIYNTPIAIESALPWLYRLHIGDYLAITLSHSSFGRRYISASKRCHRALRAGEQTIAERRGTYGRDSPSHPHGLQGRGGSWRRPRWSCVYHPSIESPISGVYPRFSRYRLKLCQLCRVTPRRHNNAFKPAPKAISLRYRSICIASVGYNDM